MITQGLRASLLLTACILLAPLSRAETSFQAWVQRYDGPGSRSDQAHAVAVDASNNVIVAGYSIGSGNNNDYLTVKYSSAGVPAWTNRYNGPANNDDQAKALKVDGNNDVIVTGSSFGGRHFDCATIKYSGTGVPLWTNRLAGVGDGLGRSLGVDSSNNVIVTGSLSGSGSHYDYATVKYSGAGEPLWTNWYNGPGNDNDYAYAVGVDGNDDVIVTGYSVGADGSYDYATIKYSSSGEPLWTSRYGQAGGSDDQAWFLAVDGKNDVIVTGCSFYFGSGDCVAIKYSSTGTPLWTNRFRWPAGNHYDYPSGVAVDGNDDVIVAGYSFIRTGTYDYATVKYSAAGQPLWTNFYSGFGNNNDFTSGLAVDTSNNVIVTGGSVGDGTTNDYLTIKYSGAGVPLWTNRYNGPGNGDDRAWAVAVDHSGDVIVTGHSSGTGSGYDFATIKYVCATWPVIAGLQLADGAFQVRVDNVSQPGTLVIEASTDLADWTPVFTNTTPTNVLFYTDTPAGPSAPSRFYRAYQFP